MRYYYEIIYEGETLDMYEENSFKYKLQANTIAELKDRQASFLNSLEIPKTSRNIRILKGLGLASDLSSAPYVKPACQLKIEGFNLIVKGWLTIKEVTDDSIKISIQSGIVEFFKAIEGKKIGSDLNLSEIDHKKNLATVISSFTSPYYRYLITDYNGKTHYSNGTKINIDYMVPSVSVKYLWDKIHSTFGFTYSGFLFDTSHFNNLFITYSKPIPLGTETELKNVSGLLNVQNRNVSWSDPNNFYNQLIAGGLDNNISFTIPETGNYRIIFECDVQRQNFNGDANYYMSVNQVGAPFHTRANPVNILTVPQYQGSQHFKTDRVIGFTQGDVIDFYGLMWANGFLGWRTDFNIKIIKVDDTNVSFSEDLSDFAITDFVKDIFNIFGLTPFANELTNNIEYKLITERLATAPVVDWSDKYIERTSETYVYEDYAKANNFRYQYNDKESDYHDGAITINNQNLSEKKEIFKSKMYSPENTLSEYYIGSMGNTFLRVFKMYDKQVKESGGTTTVTYKELDKRFHYARSNNFPTTVTIGSEALQQEAVVNSLPLIDFSGLPWQNLLNTFYYQMGRVMTDSRVHEIDLYLHPTDVLLLDLSKMYYFEQEQQYYIIDSIDYQGDEVSTGKFVRVKRDPNAVIIPEEPVDPTDYNIQIKFTDDTVDPKTGYEPQIGVKMVSLAYPATDPIISTTWQKDTGSGWVDLFTAVSPYNLALAVGVNKIRMKGVTQNGLSYYSTELQYTRLTAVCRIYSASMFAISGDVLEIYYAKCSDGSSDTASVYQGGASGWLNLSVCAIEGSASTNSQSGIVDEGPC